MLLPCKTCECIIGVCKHEHGSHNQLFLLLSLVFVRMLNAQCTHPFSVDVSSLSERERAASVARTAKPRLSHLMPSLRGANLATEGIDQTHDINLTPRKTGDGVNLLASDGTAATAAATADVAVDVAGDDDGGDDDGDATGEGAGAGEGEGGSAAAGAGAGTTAEPATTA